MTRVRHSADVGFKEAFNKSLASMLEQVAQEQEERLIGRAGSDGEECGAE